jgi:hypothetical protein
MSSGNSENTEILEIIVPLVQQVPLDGRLAAVQ